MPRDTETTSSGYSLVLTHYGQNLSLAIWLLIEVTAAQVTLTVACQLLLGLFKSAGYHFLGPEQLLLLDDWYPEEDQLNRSSQRRSAQDLYHFYSISGVRVSKRFWENFSTQCPWWTSNTVQSIFINVQENTKDFAWIFLGSVHKWNSYCNIIYLFKSNQFNLNYFPDTFCLLLLIIIC